MKKLALAGLAGLALAALYSLTALLDPDVTSKWGTIPAQYVDGAAPGVFYEVPRTTGVSALSPLCLYANLAEVEKMPGGRPRGTARFVNTVGHTWPIFSSVYGFAEARDLPFRASFEVEYEIDQLPHAFLGEIGDACMEQVRQAFQNRDSTICVVDSVLTATDDRTYVKFKPWAIVPPGVSEAEAAALRVDQKFCPLRTPSWLLWPLKERIVE